MVYSISIEQLLIVFCIKKRADKSARFDSLRSLENQVPPLAEGNLETKRNDTVKPSSW
jgi:hypothetical protein